MQHRIICHQCICHLIMNNFEIMRLTDQIERLWRDSKLLEIGGGTNEAHHKNMMRDMKKSGFKIM